MQKIQNIKQLMRKSIKLKEVFKFLVVKAIDDQIYL